MHKNIYFKNILKFFIYNSTPYPFTFTLDCSVHMFRLGPPVAWWIKDPCKQLFKLLNSNY